MANSELSERLREVIRTIPDWPKPGILFRDITTFLDNGSVFADSIDDFARVFNNKVDKIAMFDARGFIFGGALGYALGIGMIPLRKPNKLPGETRSQEYKLEYGTNTLEIPKGIITPGQKVLLLDDLCATGGTALAGVDLVEQEGGIVAGLACVVDLPDLGGSSRIKERGIEFYSQVSYGGD